MASLHDRRNAALSKITAYTNVIRTRSQDTERLLNNGRHDAREQRMLEVVERLEQVADQLEQAA